MITKTKPKKSNDSSTKTRYWSNLLLPNGVAPADVAKIYPPAFPPPLPPVLIDPRLTFRKLEYSARMSRETSAFVVSVYWDKELVCIVRNDGGGGDSIAEYLLRNAAETARDGMEQWIGTLPPASSYRYDLDWIARVLSPRTKIDVEFVLPPKQVSIVDIAEMQLERFIQKKAFRKMKSSYLSKSSETGILEFTTWSKPFFPSITPEVLQRNKMAYAIPAADVFDLPLHYYPSPHPFCVKYPPQKVLCAFDGNTYTLDYQSAHITDHAVKLKVDGHADMAFAGDDIMKQLKLVES